MAKVITDLDDVIEYINALYESDSTAPTEGDEDYTVWMSLVNVAINLWETEEGMLWRELFVKFQDHATASGVATTTTAGTYTYNCYSDFVFPASSYVWLGSGSNKTPVKVVPIENIQLYENTTEAYCYFTNDTLEFNPNMTIPNNYAINYNYYKTASKVTTGTSTFEMSDPMFVVYYVLGELKKDEGDSSGLDIASQKLNAMKTKNTLPTWLRHEMNIDPEDDGMV